MNAEQIKKQRNKIVTGTAVISIFIVIFLILSTFSIVALPVIVQPDIKPHYTEDFEDDTVGLAPTETWYAYAGDYLVSNETKSFSGQTINVSRQNNSLSLNVSANSNGTFVFNQSNYFSIDYSLFFWEDSGSLLFQFGNITNTSFTLEYLFVYNVSNYNYVYDLDDDGHVNTWDVGYLYGVYGTTGTPGWIKCDYDNNGVINFIDISIFSTNFPDYVTDSYQIIYSVFLAGLSRSVIIDTFIPSIGMPMLHTYMQFAWESDPSNFSYVYFADRGEGETLSDTWNIYDDYLYGICDIDRLEIISKTDTCAWLDNLTVGKTPYDISVYSFSPSMNATTSDILMAGCQASQPINISFDINGSSTPIFADVSAYIYSDSSSSSYTIEIPVSYSGHMYGKNIDYHTAIDQSTATDYIESDYILLGQQKYGGYWYIYRPYLVFDTSMIPSNAVIDSVNLDMHLYENITTTSGLLPGDVLSIIAGAFFDDNETSNHQDYPRQPIYISPPGDQPLSSYSGSHYEDYYDFLSIDDDSLYTTSLIDVSRVNIGAGASTRCILREVGMGEGGSQDYLSSENEVSYCKFNRTGDEKPVLRITYHVPIYTWVSSGWFSTAIIDNTSMIDDINVLFDTDYYWYINVTTEGRDVAFSWEFPQSGTIIGNKYCYHFKTGEYQVPYVNASTPAHNATDVSRSIYPTVAVTSAYNSSGYLTMYQLNNVTHIWHSMGSMSYSSGETLDMTGIGGGYDTDIYWYVNIYDNCYPEFQADYPNATQNGTYLYGHKAWKYHTEIDTPPYVVSYSPANNSHFNPWSDTIYCNITNNQTSQDVYFNFFLLEYDQWGNGTWFDDLHFIIEDNELISHPYTIYSFINGTLNFTWTPEDTKNLGYIFPFNNTNFSWAMMIWDDSNTVDFPSGFGRYYPTPTNSHIGDYWVNYISDWELGNHLPSMTITYPVSGAHYTKTQWRNNHNLRVTVNDAEGDGIYLSLTVKFDENKTMVSYLPLTSNLVNGYDYGSPPLINGTYDFDLSWYIPYDNMNYTLKVIAQDTFHPRFDGYGRSLTIPFSIGSPPGSETHLAYMRVSPSDKELDSYDSIRDGITGYVSVSTLDPSVDGLFGHAGNRPQVFIFIESEEFIDSPFIDVPFGGVKYKPIVTQYSFYAGYDVFPWTKFDIHPVMNQRQLYKMYLGLYTGGLFYGLGDYQTFTGSVEIDHLYDDTMLEKPEWRYEFYNNKFIKLIYPIPNVYSLFTADCTGDAVFTGAVSEYGTYPDGTSPSLTGSEWGRTYTNFFDDIGIGGGGIIITLIIVCGFTFMPYLFISRGVLDDALHFKRKGKNVPMPILASFALMGFIISYGMGFIDLWIFIIPVMLLLFIIVFKALAWITSRKELIGGGSE